LGRGADSIGRSGETRSEEIIAEFISTAAGCFGRKEKTLFPAGLATKLASSVILWIVGPAGKSPERIRIEWGPLLAKSTQEVGARSQQA